jgi:DNA-binding transcriptional MocR family regulator
MATSRRMSLVNQRLKVGPMKRLYKYYTPDAINLAGGVPMDSTFPIEKLAVNLSHNEEFELIKGKNLSLNYLRGDGMPSLRDWVQSHMTKLHKQSPGPDSSPFGTCVSIGSTDALAKSFTLLSGDSVLFDEFAYGTAVSSARSFGRNCVGVKMDAQGMLPDDLRNQTLLAREKGLDPDTVYLVPTAHNPTGVSMSQARKDAIYRVCQDLDLIILEDDAYYYLYHGQQPYASDSIDQSQLPGIKNLPRCSPLALTVLTRPSPPTDRSSRWTLTSESFAWTACRNSYAPASD